MGKLLDLKPTRNKIFIALSCKKLVFLCIRIILAIASNSNISINFDLSLKSSLGYELGGFKLKKPQVKIPCMYSTFNAEMLLIMEVGDPRRKGGKLIKINSW
jgi:hypothetical protein